MGKISTCKAEIDIQVRRRKVKTAAQNTFYWYDTKNKKMIVLKGGKLLFPYDPIQQRTYPKVEDLYVESDEVYKDENEVMSWVFKFQDEYQLDLVDKNERSVTVEFPEFFFDKNGKTDNKEQVDRSLSAAGLRYEITTYA